jgi:hypothetical protein
MVGVKQDSANLLDNTKVGPVHSRVTTTVFEAADLADRTEGLGSFDALVLSNVNTSSLSKDQQNALKNWVSQGGTLLLMGGNGWSKIKAGLDPSLLPFQVYDYVNLTQLKGFGEMLGDSAPPSLPQSAVVARAQVLQGASPLIVSQTDPADKSSATTLAAQRLLGTGRIIATAVDLTAPPLTDWSETTRVWQNLFSYNAPLTRATANDNSSQYRTSNDFFSLISNMPALELPNIAPFFLIFALYILVLGPLNYLGLKRIGRVGLAWLTIPVSVAVFTLATFVFVVNQQPAGQALLNQISIIQSQYDSDSVALRSYIALFSPEDKSFNVTTKLAENANAGLLYPLIHQTSVYNPYEQTQAINETGHDTNLSGFHVGQWSVEGFGVETTLSSHNYSLQATARFQDNNIVGSIHNTTNQTLHDAMLVYGEQLVRIKDLAPGETSSFSLAIPSPFDYSPAYCSNSYNSYNSYASLPATDKITAAWGQNIIDNDKNLSVRLEFIKRLFQNGEFGPLNTHRGLDLMGWLDSGSTNLINIDVANTVVQAKTQQLLVQSLPFSYQTSQGDGHLVVPVGFLRAETATNEIGFSAYTSRLDRPNQACLMAKGSLTVQFRLPTVQSNFKAQHLQLFLNSFTSNGTHSPALPDASWIYDWQNQSWTMLPNLTNSATQYIANGTNSSSASLQAKPNEITDPARYADPQTGLVLLRFDSNNNNLQIQYSLATQGSS